jgi:hypothetical protein
MDGRAFDDRRHGDLHRLPAPIGDTRPAEAEATCHHQITESPATV